MLVLPHPLEKFRYDASKPSPNLAALSAHRLKPLLSAVIASREALLIVLGALLAFWFGVWYAHQFPLNDGFHQQYMVSALEYACTGTFGRAHPGPAWTAADQVAMQQINEFLAVRQLDYSCASFPSSHLVMTGILNGAEYRNGLAPIYLSFVYGLIWRMFGVHWAATYYVIGLTAALSFLAVYFCSRPFMPTIIACAVALAFLCSPIMAVHILNPRDSLKMPFIIAAAGLLIGAGTAPRRPFGFVLFACAIGVLVGIGYGFRPDLLFVLVPAALIIGLLGQLQLANLTARRCLTSIALRMLAIGGLIASFALAGFLPLWSDYADQAADTGAAFHVLAMGQLGTHNYSLFQSNSPDGEMYMYRNDFTSDVPIGVRVMEYAFRKDGADVVFQESGGPYDAYAKQYYLDLVRLIPADLLAHAIGAFVNLMTLPDSLLHRAPEPNLFRPDGPWQQAYDFAANSYLYDNVFLPLDRFYRVAGDWPPVLLFFANVLAFFGLLCLIGAKAGIRAAFAAIICFGAAIMIVSLDFEMRHMFYLYFLPLLAWTAVIWSAVRASASLIRTAWAEKDDIRLTREAALSGIGAALPVVGMVAATLLVVAAFSLGTLEAARVYQVAALRSVVADWVGRRTVAAQYKVSALPSGLINGRTIPPDMSKITLFSPMPLSVGGELPVNGRFRPHGDMGVVEVEFDGRMCHDRTVTVAGFANSNPPPEVLGTIAYLIPETFTVRLREKTDYLVSLPAFYYGTENHSTFFKWIELPTQDVPCVKGVKLVTQFKKSDILFDFFVPEDPAYLKRRDLYQRVLIPGLGSI
jgi:hypothetical protein